MVSKISEPSTVSPQLAMYFRPFINAPLKIPFLSGRDSSLILPTRKRQGDVNPGAKRTPGANPPGIPFHPPNGSSEFFNINCYKNCDPHCFPRSQGHTETTKVKRMRGKSCHENLRGPPPNAASSTGLI